MRHAILPEGEHVRRAVHWISDRRREESDLSSMQLVDEAARRFDLSPLEEDWLMSTFAGYRAVSVEARGSAREQNPDGPPDA